jgi:hypothetical protein
VRWRVCRRCCRRPYHPDHHCCRLPWIKLQSRSRSHSRAPGRSPAVQTCTRTDAAGFAMTTEFSVRIALYERSVDGDTPRCTNALRLNTTFGSRYHPPGSGSRPRCLELPQITSPTWRSLYHEHRVLQDAGG